MPRDPRKVPLNADITKEEYAEFYKQARALQWSDKKLVENIIRYWLSLPDPKPLIKKQ